MKAEYVIGIIVVALGGLALFALLGSSQGTSTNVSVDAEYESFPYIEITDPAGYVNTNDEPFTIGQYVGEKVILLDVMTYSCINCQRTFPYVTGWYEKYKDDGFIVLGIHTPEFAFEKEKENVEEAMKRFGINFPVVLDNDYGTWGAYGNRFWPRKYLIDINGDIVYDHIGEGDYEETEMKIQELLRERADVLGAADNGFDEGLVSSTLENNRTTTQSPETYFGSKRNEFLANGTPKTAGLQSFVAPDNPELNKLYLDGRWNLTPEAAVSIRDASVVYKYNAKEVYLVAMSDDPVVVEVWQDGELVGEAAGEDVFENSLTVQESRLYKVIKNDEPGEHVLELKVQGEGVELYAFTFG